MSALDRGEYVARYGPTTGDLVRLADTGLWVMVEGDDVYPGVLEILNQPHILGSSTTPTLPLTPATIAELVPMTMTVHKLHARLGSDAAIALSRIRRHGIAAENFLHDLGAIPIINSDSMGMGRIAEVGSP